VPGFDQLVSASQRPDVPHDERIDLNAEVLNQFIKSLEFPDREEVESYLPILSKASTLEPFFAQYVIGNRRTPTHTAILYLNEYGIVDRGDGTSRYLERQHRRRVGGAAAPILTPVHERFLLDRCHDPGARRLDALAPALGGALPSEFGNLLGLLGSLRQLLVLGLLVSRLLGFGRGLLGGFLAQHGKAAGRRLDHGPVTRHHAVRNSLPPHQVVHQADEELAADDFLVAHQEIPNGAVILIRSILQANQSNQNHLPEARPDRRAAAQERLVSAIKATTSRLQSTRASNSAGCSSFLQSLVSRQAQHVVDLVVRPAPRHDQFAAKPRIGAGA
jgi:hypothetical protein